MAAPSSELVSVLATIALQIVPTKRRRQPGETHARGVMESTLKEHGEEHLLLTLRCIRETEPNKEELWSETIGAVSDVLAQRPDWQKRPSELFDAFDAIDLRAEREHALVRRPWPVRATLRARVYLALEGRMRSCASALIPG